MNNKNPSGKTEAGGRKSYVYILSCGDGTLYTGWTYELTERLERHRQGSGAKYTRGRGPFTMVYVEECIDHSAALKREIAIKSMTRQRKMELIRDYQKRLKLPE